MTLDWPRALKRFLRSPALIVGELAAVILLGGLGASLPQAGVAPAAEVARLREHGAVLASLVGGLGLDHVFTSGPFLAALGVATLSLSVVVTEQWRRLPAQWRQALTEAHFRTAPFVQEFTRRPGAGTPGTGIRTRGRWGLAGSPLFHTGLLLVILAGILRALFGVEAMVDLYEGERLPATVEAWGAQWPGPLGRPFQLDQALTLESVRSERYPSGALKDLRLSLRFAGSGAAASQELGVNQELRLGRGRLFASATHGPAALLEWQLPPAPPLRTALLLEPKEPRAFGAYAKGPGELLARVRVPFPEGDQRAEQAEVRILQGGLVLAEAVLRPGQTLALPGGGGLRLHGLPGWARLHGNHDPALGLAYGGFALALLGATLIFTVVQVDQLVSVVREGETERVRVALRPHRFAPLFKDRFDRLIRENGGEPC